jgi:hypothetical protein
VFPQLGIHEALALQLDAPPWHILCYIHFPLPYPGPAALKLVHKNPRRYLKAFQGVNSTELILKESISRCSVFVYILS